MATFVSRRVRFRVYLGDNPTGAGGMWADFGESGQYKTDNREYIETLEANSLFNQDYFRVAGDKGIIFKCPQCEYEKPNPRAVTAHALKVHKANYTKNDLIEKRVKVKV